MLINNFVLFCSHQKIMWICSMGKQFLFLFNRHLVTFCQLDFAFPQTRTAAAAAISFFVASCTLKMMRVSAILFKTLSIFETLYNVGKIVYVAFNAVDWYFFSTKENCKLYISIIANLSATRYLISCKKLLTS